MIDSKEMQPISIPRPLQNTRKLKVFLGETFLCSRWFRAEEHREEIAGWVAAYNGPRDLHLLDAFGASQAMARLGEISNN